MAKGYLYIKVDQSAGEKFSAQIQKYLPSDWDRAKDYERNLQTQSVDKNAEWYVCRNQTAAVFISRHDSETLKVTNIVPVVVAELSDPQYNDIQRQFQGIVNKTAFPSYITGEEAQLVITPRTQKSLEAFSSGANKSTGSAHASDRERWADFLVTAHEEKCYPDSGALAQYLEEKLGWSGEKAYELAGESEFAKAILDRARKAYKGA